jgi:hypothetical protein
VVGAAEGEDGGSTAAGGSAVLLADVADKSTLTAQLAEELAGLRKSRARHDPGRVLVDMAVAVADGATTISDVAVLADQAALFGAVASDSTCWRLLERLDSARLGAVGRARAAAREVVWAQRAGDRFGRLDRGVPQREGTGGADVLPLTELPGSAVVSLGIERFGRDYVPRP